MTLTAGINDIFTINAGEGIVLAPNVVSGMTVAAYCGYYQAVHEQAAAVNGHGVILNNIMLIKPITLGLSHLGTFTMTTTAGIGNIQLING